VTVVVVVMCVTAGATVLVTVVVVCVEWTTGVGFLVVLSFDVEAVVLVRGASVSITDAGCDASPIGWLKSRLAPHVTPAVSPIPRSAASVHSTVPRFIFTKLPTDRLSDGKKLPIAIVLYEAALSRSVATAPPSSLFSSVTSPPHSRASSRAIASPRPVPVPPARPARPR